MTIDTGPPVRVTVTTNRTDEKDGIRQASAHGQFDDAVREALQARLSAWAVNQVCGRVLARRPPVGEAATYEGSFSPFRQIQVVVAPAECAAGETPVCRTRRLGGLFLPEPKDGQQ